MSERFLVTGGCGFVGSSLAMALARKYPDAEVIAFDNLKRRGSELAIARLAEARVGFVHGDVRAPDDLAAIGPVTWLIECSAEPSVLAGYDASPRYLIDTNLGGAVNCLEHLRRFGGRMIFLSSSRVYPIAGLRALPLALDGERLDIEAGAAGEGWSRDGINEAFPLDGVRSLYGMTKLSAELAIQEYGAAYGIDSVINRCGVICGAWQMGKVDQGFVALWMARHAFGGELSYIGFDGDGYQVRDVLDVRDLARLVITQIEGMDRFSGSLYNAGGGFERSLSLRQLTGLCRELTGNEIAIGRIEQTHPTDIPYYVTDNAKVTRETGWAPTTPLADTLEEIHRWLSDNREALRPLFTPVTNS